MKRKTLISLTAIILILLIAVITLYKKSQTFFSQPAFSPNISSLKQPITSIQGIIDKVEGNSISVSHSLILQKNTNTIINDPLQNKLTYQVLLTDKTTISRQTPSLSYLLKPSILSKNETISIHDLKAGQFVSIDTDTDLRTLKNNQFKFNAVNITLPPIMNSIGGVVTGINGQELKVKATIPLTAKDIALNKTQTEDKIFTITADQNTEISRNIPPSDPSKPAKPEKLSLSDLKKGMQVTVYSDADFALTVKGKALRIEPFIPTPPLKSE